MATEELQPLDNPGSLTERTASVLRERILTGDFAMGERLNEAAIARQLGISRGPVREALKELGAEGLVHESPRRGAFIVELTAKDVAEIYELRAAIETRAVRLLLARKDPSLIGEIEAALAQLKKAARAGDRKEVARLDLDFHALVCKLSGNNRLHRVFVSQAAILRALLIVEEAEYFASLTEIARQHEPLVKALKGGKTREAEAAFNAHLEDAKDRLIAYIDRVLVGQESGNARRRVRSSA